MSDLDTLRGHFTNSLALSPDAVEWLLSLYQVIQFFDDVADGDKVERNELNQALWNSLVAFPQNAFYFKHMYLLLPVVANAILKWQASDNAERAGAANEKSFVWRASYYDVVLTVVQICHGHEVAAKVADKVLGMYGENYQDYLKEF